MNASDGAPSSVSTSTLDRLEAGHIVKAAPADDTNSSVRRHRRASYHSATGRSISSPSCPQAALISSPREARASTVRCASEDPAKHFHRLARRPRKRAPRMLVERNQIHLHAETSKEPNQARSIVRRIVPPASNTYSIVFGAAREAETRDMRREASECRSVDSPASSDRARRPSSR